MSSAVHHRTKHNSSPSNLQFYKDTNATAEPKYDASASKSHLVSSWIIYSLVGTKSVGTEKRDNIFFTEQFGA